ncbi:hypothetical protein MTR_4g028890 [Medicago truncatula]|uniref:Uncharacterized protein n=1 Tax=Medicago truncatula TaxID=3880 RepID=A0A072UHH1_MEDTR|nr:hypothetical protein MTR_4g028890 [Medicago truncatula]
MAITPRPDGHPQKISAMGRVKPRFYRYGLVSGEDNVNGYGHLGVHKYEEVH